MPNLLEFVIGDWSDDGHGKTETFLITSNKTRDEIREAYKVAVVKHNFALHNQNEGYDRLELPKVEYCASDEYSHNFNPDGFWYIRDLMGHDQIDGNGDPYWPDADEYFEIFLWMVKSVLEDFEYERVMPETITGYGFASFGYELFMSDY